MTRGNAEIFHPDAHSLRLEKILHALGDPLRMAIVRRIAQLDNAANCTVLNFGRPKSSVSHHFRVLREAGVVWTSVEGQEHINSLRLKDLDQRFPGLMDAILASDPTPSPSPQPELVSK